MKLKEIESINKVTVVDLIDALQSEAGIDFESFVYRLFTPEEVYETKQLIEELVQGKFLDEKAKKAKRIELLRDGIEQSDINESRDAKIEVLMNLYEKRKEYKPGVNAEVKRLLLDGRPFMVSINRRETDQMYEFAIIMREKSKKLEDIKSNNLRSLFRECIDKSFYIEDLPSFAKYDELGDAIYKKLLLEFEQEEQLIDRDMEELAEKPYEKVTKRAEEVLEILQDNEDLNDKFYNYTKDYILNNVHYIDADRLLINTATRLIAGLKTVKGEELEGIHVTGITGEKEDAIKSSIYFLREIYKELLRSKKAEDLTHCIYTEDGKPVIEVNLEYIKDFLSRCTEKDYITEEEIKTIHEDIKSGKLPDDLETRRIAGIDIEDLMVLDGEIVTEKDEKVKEKLLTCSSELIDYLKKEKGLSEETIIEMYLDEKLSKDITQSVELSELGDEYYIDTFGKLYEDTLNERDKDKIKKLKAFTELINKKIEDEKLDKYDLFLEFLGNYKEDGILDLYELEVISLEDSIDIAGQDILDKIFTNPNKKLQPAEIRNLYYKNMVTSKKISSLINKLQTIEEKYLTIISIFPDTTDEQIRRFLIDDSIIIESQIQNKSGNKRISKGTGNNDLGNNYKKHLTDSLYRLQLIHALDPTYYEEILGDGHVVIRMPKFGKVMIEKLMDKKGNEGYGAATYVMDEKFYDDNVDEIKIDNEINRKKLVEAAEENNAIRFRHTIKTWGREVKENFVNSGKVQYTLYELNQINNIIQKIINSEREVDY